MEHVLAWWRARTARERTLLQGAGVLVFAVILPAWAYVSAASFRRDAAEELASARRVETQVARLAEAGATAGAADAVGDTSIRGRALAAAQGASLVAQRVEPGGPDRVRIVFEPADSLAVYRWIDQVGRSGAIVTQSSIVRVGETDLVRAEFEVAANP